MIGLKKARAVALGVVIALPFTAASAVMGQQPTPKHHSKVKGAVVGAVAGHVLGGHAAAGAVAGAAVQHHRNHSHKTH